MNFIGSKTIENERLILRSFNIIDEVIEESPYTLL